MTETTEKLIQSNNCAQTDVIFPNTNPPSKFASLIVFVKNPSHASHVCQHYEPDPSGSNLRMEVSERKLWQHDTSERSSKDASLVMCSRFLSLSSTCERSSFYFAMIGENLHRKGVAHLILCHRGN